MCTRREEGVTERGFFADQADIACTKREVGGVQKGGVVVGGTDTIRPDDYFVSDLASEFSEKVLRYVLRSC